MYCKNCGKKIADDSKFCQHCGTRQFSEPSDDTTTLPFEEIKTVPQSQSTTKSRTKQITINGFVIVMEQLNDDEFLLSVTENERELVKNKTIPRNIVTAGDAKIFTYLYSSFCICVYPDESFGKIICELGKIADELNVKLTNVTPPSGSIYVTSIYREGTSQKINGAKILEYLDKKEADGIISYFATFNDLYMGNKIHITYLL